MALRGWLYCPLCCYANAVTKQKTADPPELGVQCIAKTFIHKFVFVNKPVWRTEQSLERIRTLLRTTDLQCNYARRSRNSDVELRTCEQVLRLEKTTSARYQPPVSKMTHFTIYLYYIRSCGHSKRHWTLS